jgi:hypothetical protein
MPKILVRFRFWAIELLNFAIVEILLTPQHTSYTGEHFRCRNTEEITKNASGLFLVPNAAC